MSEDFQHVLRQNLKAIKALKTNYDRLKTEKQKIDIEIKPYKVNLGKALVNSNLKKLEWNEFQVEKVEKKQQRRPSLKMAYKAIENTLGKDVVEIIKSDMTQLREKRKRDAKKVETLMIVKIGDLRKPRKDKLPTDQLKKNKKTTTVTKKRKFLKRKKD